MWQDLEAEARRAMREAAAVLEEAVPQVLRALAQQAAAGDRRAERLLRRVIWRMKGGRQR